MYFTRTSTVRSSIDLPLPPSARYIVIPGLDHTDAIANDSAALAGWLEKSVGYVLTLPKPRAKSGGRK